MNRLLRAALLVAAASTGVEAPAARAEPPVHHAIEARLDPEGGGLEVTDIVTVSGRAAVGFRLAPWLEVEAMAIDGRPVEAPAGTERWRVTLPDRDEHRIELRLSGAPPSLPAGPGRDPFQGAVSGPAGSYLPGHAAWFPTTDDAWIAYRLSVDVPAPYRAVASGRIEDETVGEARTRAVFAADYPSEPPSLFAGPYEVRERRDGPIRIRTYFHAELAELAEPYLDASARYLRRFEERIGPYPFQDFHVIAAPLPVGLGFPNLTYVGRRVLPLPFMLGRSLAHEVLHNWWGNGVAVDYAQGNWAEGLTTYMADYALAAEKSPEAAREMRLGWLRNYAALPAEHDGPVTAFTAKRHDADQVIGYDKVAFIFHMLERRLGTTAFTEGLRRFWRDRRFSVAGWAELRADFEAESGQDLGWFFEQWLDRTGAPRLSLGAVDARAEGDAYRVTVTVRQDGPAYRIAIPVIIETESGPVREGVELDGRKATASFALDARPSAFHLDPGYDLFRRLLPGEAPPILRDVTLAARATTVIAAEDRAVRRTAHRLAAHLLDATVDPAPAEPSKLEPAPLLLIGTTPEVASFLARAGLEGVPKPLAGRGTARVWTARWASGHALLAVAADDGEALEALLRPLPHYGRRSYLVFEGRRAVDSGTWPVEDSPLSRLLDR